MTEFLIIFGVVLFVLALFFMAVGRRRYMTQEEFDEWLDTWGHMGVEFRSIEDGVEKSRIVREPIMGESTMSFPPNLADGGEAIIIKEKGE